MAAVSWEWQGDGHNQWVPYDAIISNALDAAFASNQQPNMSYFSVHGGRAGTGATYVCDFTKFVQTNQGTGFLRNMRRRSSTTPQTWEFLGANGWEAYDTSASALISLAQTSGRQAVTLHLAHASYHIDVRAWQQRNLLTNVPRQIRVAQAAAHAPAAAAAAAAAAAPGGITATNTSSSSSNGGAPSAEFRSGMAGMEDCTAATVEDDICPLCHEGFNAEEEGCQAMRLRDCQGHYMHTDCIIATFRALGPKCPTCNKLYGVVTGTQPDGTMTVSRLRQSCEGNQGVGTIVITYSFPSGTQGSKHPSPGAAYHGTHRTAYLPDSAEGKAILALLQTAFERRLTFTVGTSVTTGRSNCVVWSGIHHKTSMHGGFASFGYPDTGYLARVRAELASKGVTGP